MRSYTHQQTKVHRVEHGPSEETIAFRCHVTSAGMPIAIVSNDGRGGCHTWRPLAPTTHREMDAYRKALREDVNADIGGDLLEADDNWITCLACGLRSSEAVDELRSWVV